MILYKYLPPERKFFLDNGLLRMTQAVELNDPFECFPQIQDDEIFIRAINEKLELEIEDLDKKGYSDLDLKFWKRYYFDAANLEILKIMLNAEDSLKNKNIKASMELLNKNLGIISLSSNSESSLMWSHYTNSHKGFCVGLDFENEFFKNLDKSIWLDKVSYSEERILAPEKINELIDKKVFFQKSEEWRYENEYRLIISFSFAEKEMKSNPYNIYLYKFPFEAINEIIMGCNISDIDQKFIESFCKQRNVQLYKAVLSSKYYRMDRIKIPL